MSSLLDDKTSYASYNHIYVEPNTDQYNRYNITSPRDFMIYNEELLNYKNGNPEEENKNEQKIKR